MIAMFSSPVAAQGFGFLWSDSWKVGKEEFLVRLVGHGHYYCCKKETPVRRLEVLSAFSWKEDFTMKIVINAL